MTTPSISNKFATIMRATVLTLATLAFTAPALAATAPAPATASDCAATNNCISAGASAAQASGTSADLAGIFATVSNTLIYIVGAVAVIFLIIGGLRYVISNGDPKAVTAAKDTILYAIIGIVVAILSYAAVNFVISRFITP